MAVKALFDSNAVIYQLEGRWAAPIPPLDLSISVITEIEVLSWPEINAAEEREARAFIAALAVVELTPAIRKRAIDVRRRHKLKLPDAVIAATALDLGTALWTNDTVFARVDGLTCRSVELLPG